MVLSMQKWKGKVAIVTGASSGIGAAIADKLVQEGLIVVGIARRSDLINERAKTLSGSGRLYSYQADVTKEEEIVEAFKWVTKNIGLVHILVNSAGYAKYGSILDDDSETWKRVFDVNVMGLSVATREAVKIMKENNVSGHIIHINSSLGHRVKTSVFNVYPASKFAVTALTETLRQELTALGLKIKITSLSPGLVETEMTTLNKNLTPEWKKMFENRETLKSEDIADGVAYVLSTPEHVQIHELNITPFY